MSPDVAAFFEKWFDLNRRMGPWYNRVRKAGDWRIKLEPTPDSSIPNHKFHTCHFGHKKRWKGGSEK